MWKEITLWMWIFVVVLAAPSLAATVATAVDDTNASKVIKESPVIIETVSKHYENPSIDEYHKCVKKRDKCLDSCKFMDRDCQSKCPTCPVLYNHDVLVQGINDTDYRPPVETDTISQTNIIRVINEIRNIIDSKLGNISSNNQNLINVYQNRTSKTGGKYGLGYNDRGPCCHLIEPKRCKRSAAGFNCIPRRQRTCGSHCISRVMRAKRVVSCNEMNPADCESVMEYIPEHRRPGCRYTSRYPFIDCVASTNRMPRASNCARCLNIPYMNVMRGRVPRDCLRCYGHSRSYHQRPFYPPTYHPLPSYPYPMYSPSFESYITLPPYDYDFENDWSSAEDDFNEHNIPVISKSQDITKHKCNGTSEEDCQMDENKDDGEIELNKDSEQEDEDGDETYEDDNDDEDSN